jgi:hypothetical protein
VVRMKLKRSDEINYFQRKEASEQWRERKKRKRDRKREEKSFKM